MSVPMHTDPRLTTRPQAAGAGRAMRIGCVSFLNTKPLIYGLESDPNVELHLAVPADLLDGLRADHFRVALLPVIDYQRMEGLTIVPAGGIGSDGETLTVRIFSRCPVESIRTLACDPDSHTSVALARVILAERFGIHPEFVDLRQGSANDACQARLLIGDKVVCAEPQGFDHQLDLGAAWKELTGLPFVFAVWQARGGEDLPRVYRTLETAKRRGLQHVDDIVRDHALRLGWPAELARKYLTEHLSFDVDERELEAIRRFHGLAHRHRMLERKPRELAVFRPDGDEHRDADSLARATRIPRHP